MFPAHIPPELADHLRRIGIALPPPAKPGHATATAPADIPPPLAPAVFDADGEPDF